MCKANNIKMTYLFETYKMYNLFIDVYSYNKNFIENPYKLLNLHGMILEDFIKSPFEDYLEFLYDSVENNTYLSDIIKEVDFTVKDDVISMNDETEPTSYINMGEVVIDRFRIYLCGSFEFIVDLVNDKKYMYYGD